MLIVTDAASNQRLLATMSGDTPTYNVLWVDNISLDT